VRDVWVRDPVPVGGVGGREVMSWSELESRVGSVLYVPPTKHGEGGHRRARVRSKTRVALRVTMNSRSVQGDRQKL
jgi:hypothetical protein